MEVEPKSLNLINDLRKLTPLNVRALSDFALGGGGEVTAGDLYGHLLVFCIIVLPYIIFVPFKIFFTSESLFIR